MKTSSIKKQYPHEPCDFCARFIDNKCSKEVPWYCVTINCDLWQEPSDNKVRDKVYGKRWLNRILVDTV